MDYEALGRYTEKKEELVKLVGKRNDLIRKNESLNICTHFDCYGYRIHLFDYQVSQNLLSEIVSIENEIRKTIEELNYYAPKCDKPIYETTK